MLKSLFASILFFSFTTASVFAQSSDWYTEGDFSPYARVKITLKNTLSFDRVNCPITITRDEFPVKNLGELWITVVDPSIAGVPQPTKEELSIGGGHRIQKETNGHQIYSQLDDLDKDGVWDELFFQTDIKANQTRTLFVYIGFTQRGWNTHGTHGAIGSYVKHQIPFWESAHVGWKLWYPTDCDFYGKRKGVLMSNELYMKNLNGYAVPFDYGSDIMTVSDSFGAGGICLFDCPAQPDSVSRPRFTKSSWGPDHPSGWNGPQMSDTRYAFDVIVNGPMRSIIKVKTFNWQTGNGLFELEQYYTAYTNQNYSTCKVKYNEFLPGEPKTAFGCGIRKSMGEKSSYIKGGIVITIGQDAISSPDDPTGLTKLKVDYIGTALVVKDSYKPEFQFVPAHQGNYTFRIPVTPDYSFEYMIAGAWSEGAFLKTPKEFTDYMIKTAQEYNNPVKIGFGPVENK
jgi:hypothetical protein